MAQSMLVQDDGFVPKERYTSREFLDLEMDRLWSRVLAGRLPRRGGGATSATTSSTRSATSRSSSCGPRPTTVKAYFNACLHRGTRLADGTGNFADGEIRCRFHAWRYDLDGRLTDVVDREEFGDRLPDGLGLAEVRCESWGGFVFVNLDPDAEPLLEFLDPLPTLLAPYHLDEMRLRGHLTTILPANWKVVVDAFNEAYHVQGTHPQLLPWTDDVSIEYEQLGKHSHYGRLADARRVLRPSPRLGLTDDEIDEGEILAGLVARSRGRVPEGGTRARRRRPRRDAPRRHDDARDVPGAPDGSCSPRAASTSPGSSPTR